MLSMASYNNIIITSIIYWGFKNNIYIYIYVYIYYRCKIDLNYNNLILIKKLGQVLKKIYACKNTLLFDLKK